MKKRIITVFLVAIAVAGNTSPVFPCGWVRVKSPVILNVFRDQARNKPKVLFLPLVPKDRTSQDLCDKITADLAAELKKTGLFYLKVSENYMAELNITDYSFYNTALREKILERCTPDYVMTGYVATDSATGNYMISIRISDFSRSNNEYDTAFHGMKDIRTLIASHVKNINNLRIFMPDADVKQKKYIKILKDYSPDSYSMLSLIMNKSLNYDILTYIREAGPLSSEMNTAVHEGNHIYTNFVSVPRTLNFFIRSGETINVTRTDVFPSRDISDAIPENLRTFRYKNYIVAPYSSSTTQDYGIYGLLDEFNSYYQGTLASCNILGYYKINLFKDKIDQYFEFLSGIYSTYFAYYEFKYFIYTYLLYAKKKRPEVYRDVVNNADFIRVFNRVDELYRALNVKIGEIEQEINRCLNNRGLQLSKNKGFTWIGSMPGSGTGRSNFSETVDLLSQELKKDIYVRLEKEVFSR